MVDDVELRIQPVTTRAVSRGMTGRRPRSVGTPKGGFVGSRKRCWRSRDRKHGPGVDRKLLPQGGELYVYAQSRDRVAKERAMHRRKIETFKNLKG
ncbi:MAG: hypothetical protein ACREXJ_05930, partial [Gammaproteobacteria bacterium]